MKFFLLLAFHYAYLIAGRIIVKNLNEFESAIVYSGNVAEVQRIIFIYESLGENQFHSVNVKGFSSKTQEETVRIKGTEGSEILDFTLSTVVTQTFIGGVTDEEKGSIIQEISEYNRLISDLDLQKSALDLEVSNAQSRLKAAEEMVNLSLKYNKTVSEAMELLDFYSKELATHRVLKSNVATQLLSISEKKTNFSSHSQTLYAKQRSGHYQNKNEKELSFRFRTSHDVSPENPLAFSISYMIPGASWSPEYDIRVENSKNSTKTSNGPTLYRMEIDYFANVWQNSDEHWVDTELTLSTSNPGILGRHPEPHRKSVGIKLPVQHFHTQPGQPVRFGSMPTVHPSSLSSFAPSVTPSAAPSSTPTIAPSAVPTEAPTAVPTCQPTRRPTCQPTGQLSGLPTVVDMDFSATAADSMASSNSISLGDIGASHMFQVSYPVTVHSKDLLHKELTTNSTVQSLLSYKQLILIEKVVIENTQLFTYAVPSQHKEAFLMGWGKYSSNCTSEEVCMILSPLLASKQVHVRIQGDNIGTVPQFDTVQPGQTVKLNLGSDKHIHITTSAVLPTHKGEEEDKSTWFVTDKKKYRVRTEERTTMIRSSHTTQDALVIISENLPRSTEEDDITVELLTPLMTDMQSLSKSVQQQANKAKPSTAANVATSTIGTGNDDFTAAILEKESNRNVTVSTAQSTSKVFYCKESGNIYWSMWLKPGESVVVPYKYKIMWPEEMKNVDII